MGAGGVKGLVAGFASGLADFREAVAQLSFLQST